MTPSCCGLGAQARRPAGSDPSGSTMEAGGSVREYARKVRVRLLPTVTCILAGTDGKVEEVRVNMNEDEPFKKYVGGPAPLLGDWKPCGTCALVCEREVGMEKSLAASPYPEEARVVYFLGP